MISDNELESTLSKSREFTLNKTKIHKTFTTLLSSNKLRQINQIVLFEACKSGVIFGQEEAGSGVIVSADGCVLTCAHCLGDTPTIGQHNLLILFDSRIVVAEALKIELKRDTALLKVIAFVDQEGCQSPVPQNHIFPFIRLATSEPNLNDLLLCVGQPASEDLESVKARKTGYPVIKLSFGSYLGVKSGDVHNNRNIGKLMHDCWTYWDTVVLLQSI
jgi:hypothetical protein